jgi:hypothetical protein
VSDVAQIQAWFDKLGYAPHAERGMLRVKHPSITHPPFFAQISDNWLLLSILPVLGPDDFRPDDLGVRLMLENRAMRMAKYAVDANDAIVLCAELPTESLDFSELEAAADRLVRYAHALRAELGAVSTFA